jgi:hypothetical protein
MAAKKAAKAATQAPQVINAAPSFTPPPAAYPPPAPFTPPAGGVPGFTPPNGAFTAPPPQAPKNPFINAMFLYQRGGSVQAKILALRPIPGGAVNKFGQVDRGGWYLDCQLTDGTMVTARVNIGDQRHQRLFAKYQSNIVGQAVTFRLPTPADNTKAAWTVDA